MGQGLDREWVLRHRSTTLSKHVDQFQGLDGSVTRKYLEMRRLAAVLNPVDASRGVAEDCNGPTYWGTT